MEKLNTSDIYNWPRNVYLGMAEISDQRSLDIFSAQEKKEFEGFGSPKRKAEYLSGRHLFRFLLRDLNLPERDVHLYKDESGKPRARHKNQSIYLSFSHSPGKVFCAVSFKHELGLDVEQTDREISNSVVQRILNEQERNSIGEEDPVRLWTIKEAAVKYLGTGLRTNLNDLTIIKKEKSYYSVRFNNEKLIEICSFSQSDHQIALAYQSRHI